MIKQINRILKLVGFNLVRAKRPKVKWTGRLVTSTASAESEGLNILPEQKETPFEQLSVADKLNVLRSERHCEVADGAPAPTFQTSGYLENALRNTCIGPEARVHVVDPDAAFVPVDIGVNDHKMTDAEHWETAGGTTPEQNETRFNEPK